MALGVAVFCFIVGLASSIEKALNERKEKILRNYKSNSSLTLGVLIEVHDVLHTVMSGEERIRKNTFRGGYLSVAIVIFSLLGLILGSSMEVRNVLGSYSGLATTCMDWVLVALTILCIVTVSSPSFFLLRHYLRKDKS